MQSNGRVSLFAAVLTVAIVAVAVLFAPRDLDGNTFRTRKLSPPRLANRSRCVAVNFESIRDSFEAVNRAIDHAQYFQLCDRVLSSVDPLKADQLALKPLAVAILGAKGDVSVNIRRLDVSGLRTLTPMHVNVSSRSSLQVGWRSTGTLAVEATVDVGVAQREKQWWQPCWVSLWHPSSCPARSLTLELAMAIANASGVAEVQVEIFQCLPGSEDDCQDLSAMDVVAAIIRGRPQEFLLRLCNRIDRLALQGLALDLGHLEHLRVHIQDASNWTNALVDGAVGVLKRRLNHKGTLYRAVLNGVRDELVAAANKAIGRWISPLFHGSCVDDAQDAATVFSAD